MRLAFVALALVTACNSVGSRSEATLPGPTTSSSAPSTSQTGLTTTTTRASGGELVRIDPLSLTPVAGLDPIPYAADSWNIVSADESWLVNFEWDYDSQRIVTARAIDLENWEQTAELEVDFHFEPSLNQGKLYTLSDTGLLSVHDLQTGKRQDLTTWPINRWPWGGFHVLSHNRVAALMTSGSGSDDLVLVYDPATATTKEIAIGSILRTNSNTGVFDGDYEIPATDSPGVVWLDDRVLVVHAESPEILEVDLNVGTIETHIVDTTTWWGRLIHNWFPAAVAKGPSLGIYSTAALSSDGRYLFISGNRHMIEVADNGQLVESSEHLGLTVVDIETWSKVAAPELDLQHVRNDGGMVLGVNTISQQPWHDELYVMDVDSDGVVRSMGPFLVRGGGCQLGGETEHLVCTEHSGETTLLRVVSLQSGETLAERAVSSADYFHPNGVLEDWAPISR